MDHTKETSIVIRMTKEEASVLNKLLGELKVLKNEDCDLEDWTLAEHKVIQDMLDILTMY